MLRCLPQSLIGIKRSARTCGCGAWHGLQARVEQAQCSAIVKAADAALACAVAYLQAGSVDACTAGLAKAR